MAKENKYVSWCVDVDTIGNSHHIVKSLGHPPPGQMLIGLLFSEEMAADLFSYSNCIHIAEGTTNNPTKFGVYHQIF